MNTLREALQEYLALRRGLGYKMHDAGRLLPRFVSFLEERQAKHITARLALEWAQQAHTVQPAERARRLCFVRGFARYRSAADARTEIPPVGVLPYRSTRARPYLYTEQEVQRLLDAALKLPTPWRIDAIATVGVPLPARFAQRDRSAHLRGARPEARRRRPRSGRADDPSGQARSIPSGAASSVDLCRAGRLPSASRAVRRQRAAAATCSSPPAVRAWTSAAFIEPSTRYRDRLACARPVRVRVRGCTTSDIASPSMTLTRWYESGEDAARRLPVLSTYLGHVYVADTYWYLSGWPELMAQAMARLERRWGEPS